MRTPPERPLAGVSSRPALPRHVRMHFDPHRGAWALLSPEKVLWPDEISLAILRRCDGRSEAGTIARELALEYEADEAEVRADVLAFLQDWSDRMVVRL
uniref:pyrroloquinoline quinone biosynthesis peptide chaperone PqqD n=1 Tax=Aureimonas psammosilenae TaxID=2495496 RepID=UPI001F2EA674|nr:pyrroloquinoline quinone biosynthesis peptide chaperone PqqD [Aureimonas psammosilenae]